MTETSKSAKQGMNTERPVYLVTAGKIEFPEALDLALHTQDPLGRWCRRGVIDSVYIDERSRLVSIGVDQRDIIDVDLDQPVLLVGK